MNWFSCYHCRNNGEASGMLDLRTSCTPVRSFSSAVLGPLDRYAAWWQRQLRPRYFLPAFIRIMISLAANTLAHCWSVQPHAQNRGYLMNIHELTVYKLPELQLFLSRCLEIIHFSNSWNHLTFWGAPYKRLNSHKADGHSFHPAMWIQGKVYKHSLCNEFTGCALSTCQHLQSHGFQASYLVCCRWHMEYRTCFSLSTVTGTSHESCFRRKPSRTHSWVNIIARWKFICHTSLLEVEGNFLPSLLRVSSGECINQLLNHIRKTY